jgi:hypothetical protein
MPMRQRIVYNGSPCDPLVAGVILERHCDEAEPSSFADLPGANAGIAHRGRVTCSGHILCRGCGCGARLDRSAGRERTR